METRINKYLVTAGLADSRRKADAIIVSGRVTVNEETVRDLAYKVSDSDIVKVDGIEGEIKKDIYIAYNKPKGEICSHRRFGNDKTIFDSLPSSFSKLKIAGRLDRDSEGLVILSSDGDFINNISHPSKAKSKAYMINLKNSFSLADAEKINAGIELEDGISLMKVTKLGDKAIKIVMSEGKNRQIRRTIDEVDNTVVKLVRVRIGKYSSRSIEPSNFVFIGPEDVL
ncbi:MAG: pseudouridine synthase [Candidatus Saccharibacteria bacterium]